MNTTENITDESVLPWPAEEWSEFGWMLCYDLEGWPETSVGFVDDLESGSPYPYYAVSLHPSNLEGYLAQQKRLDDTEKRRLELDRLRFMPYITD